MVILSRWTIASVMVIPMTKTMDYCEFSSIELLAMAKKNLRNARELSRLSTKLSDDCLMSAYFFLEQAEQQLIHNEGRAYVPAD